MEKKIRKLAILSGKNRGVANNINARIMFYCVFLRKILIFSP